MLFFRSLLLFRLRRSLSTLALSAVRALVQAYTRPARASPTATLGKSRRLSPLAKKDSPPPPMERAASLSTPEICTTLPSVMYLFSSSLDVSWRVWPGRARGRRACQSGEYNPRSSSSMEPQHVTKKTAGSSR